MNRQKNNPVEVLRQGLVGSCQMNNEVTSAAALLASRLEVLKRTSPMFEMVSFSPEAEAMVEAHLAVAAN